MILFNYQALKFKYQLWLLLIFSLTFSSTTFAQINLNIKIHGVSEVMERNIRELLSIEQQKDHTLLSEGRLYHLHKKAEKEISSALQPYGYYRAEIKKELIKQSQNQWQAIYTVNPGPPIPIAELNIILSEEIKNDPEFKSLLENMTLHIGEPFSHIKYEDLKKELARLAAEQGYFRAHFVEHRVEINLNTYQAHVNLHFDGGIRYNFGQVLLNQTVLDPAFLQKYILFKRGQPYVQNELIELQQALNDSDYFSHVEVSPGQLDDSAHELSVKIKLTPRKKHRYSAGLGYGTDTGARAKFGWEIPLYNKSGHRIKTEASVSEIGYSAGVQYRVPVLNPRTDQMIYSAGVINQKTTTSDSTVSTIGASLNHSLGLWRQSIALNYQKEEFIVGADQGISKLLMPSITLSRTWGNNFIYAIDGLRFDVSLRGASEELLSDNSFLQLHGGIKAITPLWKSNRMITRGRLGTTWTDDFHELPASVRFFAGGAQSVRGYSYQSLGPTDTTGTVIGGRHLMIGSIEFEHNLSDKWGVALFYDAGNAYDNLDDKLEHGAGFGFRWKSPIGSVRIDFASAISQPNQPWRLHINIGPDL
ncbi:MAG: autotransporter assembly complex protein TamA [Gammaproteobacteria bacterium]|nr:autotransporter assembly complex protein TamA [Gammaproteobacteria bacterium]MCW8986560.1 autotransporter assembly complex protein TamA [Gammaproteobacteria bacterium]